MNAPLSCSGMARILKRSQFYLHTPRSSANRMNHTYVCLLSWSWSSFTNPVRIEGLGWLVRYGKNVRHRELNPDTVTHVIVTMTRHTYTVIADAASSLTLRLVSDSARGNSSSIFVTFWVHAVHSADASAYDTHKLSLSTTQLLHHHLPTAVPRSTQPSTLRGTVKWVSAYEPSNNNKWRWCLRMIAADRQTHSPNRLVWSEGWRPPGAQSAFIK